MKVYRKYQFHTYQGSSLTISQIESFDVLDAIRTLNNIIDLSTNDVREIYEASDMQQPRCIFNFNNPNNNTFPSNETPMPKPPVKRTFALYTADGINIMQGFPKMLYSNCPGRYLDAIVVEVFGTEDKTQIGNGQIIGRYISREEVGEA